MSEASPQTREAVDATARDTVGRQARDAVAELLDIADFRRGQLFLLGGSTSEVAGERIGTASSLDIARIILEPVLELVHGRGGHLAVQCCEHLNRALVVSTETAEAFGLEPVTVIPQPKAGGALATAAMELLEHPVVVESCRAHAGIDIGQTLIGMHLRAVAVPVRLGVKHIGQAVVTAARTRPKLIGGARAKYPDSVR